MHDFFIKREKHILPRWEFLTKPTDKQNRFDCCTYSFSQKGNFATLSNKSKNVPLICNILLFLINSMHNLYICDRNLNLINLLATNSALVIDSSWPQGLSIIFTDDKIWWMLEFNTRIIGNHGIIDLKIIHGNWDSNCFFFRIMQDAMRMLISQEGWLRDASNFCSKYYGRKGLIAERSCLRSGIFFIEIIQMAPGNSITFLFTRRDHLSSVIEVFRTTDACNRTKFSWICKVTYFGEMNYITIISSAY